MRIRRNTEELSSMLLPTECYGEETSETYCCHLNQSPWDVIPATSVLTNIVDSSSLVFPSPSSSSPLMFPQFDGEDDFNGNVSLGNFAAERIKQFNRSLVSVERLNLIAAEDIYERSPEFEDAMDLNSPVNTSGEDEQMAVMSAPPKRGRPRGTTKKNPASAAASKNPYEFYYYSGFGPRWGRKRGGSGDEKVVNEKSISSSDDEEEEESAYGGGDNSYDYDQDSDDEKMSRREKLRTMQKKKIKSCRKPVKERSLQSLM